MVPIWNDQDEASEVYERVHRHSDGMISIAYEPPSQAAKDVVSRLRTFSGGIVAAVVDPTSRATPERP